MQALPLRAGAGLLFIALLLAAPAMAEQSAEKRRSVTVYGQGEASGPPDLASISAGVQTLAKTVAEATDQNQAALDKIMAAIRKHGIEAKDIQTSDYSVWPEQREDRNANGGVTITGYRVNNTVRLTVRDIDKLGEILTALTDAGANSIHGIEFQVEDTDALEQQARSLAMQDARERAEALAGLADLELGDVLHISIGGGGGVPRFMGHRMEMAHGSDSVGISEGQLTVTVSVQVVYEIH